MYKYFIQKKIIYQANKIFINSKSKFSIINYFILWANVPGSLFLKFKIYGYKYSIKFILSFIKFFLSIGLHLNYSLIKSTKIKNNYSKVIISWAFENNFKKNGIYHDKYFNISSRQNKNILWFLVYESNIIPKKIDDNIVLLYKNSNNFNFIYFIKFIFKIFYENNFSIKKSIVQLNSFESFSKIFQYYFFKCVKIKNIKKIFFAYEGQIFQKNIIKYLKKKNNKIKFIGYDHTPPQPLPLNLIHDKYSPDKILTCGRSQLGFYTQYLKWPTKKVKVVPSLRFQFVKKNYFKNKIFLPFNIEKSSIVLNEFEDLIQGNKIKNIGNFLIKNHPARLNSNTHLNFIKELKTIIQSNGKKFLKDENNSVIIFGQTTAVSLAIELGFVCYHVCLNPDFDHYNQHLWKKILSTKLSDHIFKYKLKNKSALLLIKKEKKIFDKYYDC